jgi:hypothetical protein
MGWFCLFLKENMIRSFRLWERAAAVTALIIGGVAAIFTLVIRSQLPGFTAEQYVGIGLALWFVFLVVVVTPTRMAIEKVKLAEKKLIVVGSETYDCGRGYNWLRLKVENPSGAPIPNCYGKLCARKMVATSLTRVDDESVRLSISPESGGKSLAQMELPPEGHKFPWSPEQLPDTTITIPGFGSPEYLYYVVKHKGGSAFGFPSGMGIKYNNFSLGDFELEIEVGSESEVFKPARVCIVFRAEGGDLQFVSIKDIN